MTTQQKLTRLLHLRDKIDDGTAVLKDYQEYESILRDRFTHEEILMKIRRHGYNNWEDYIRARKKAKSYRERKNTEGETLGAILGLATALLLLYGLTQGRK